MFRLRQHSRPISSSYLRRKNLNGQIERQTLQTAHTNDSDYAFDSFTSEDDEDRSSHAMDINTSDYSLMIAKFFDEINVSDSTQIKFYDLIRKIGREKIFLPSFADFHKKVNNLNYISVKKFIHCGVCNIYHSEKKRCNCVENQLGDLRVFNLEDTLKLFLRNNQEYFNSSTLTCDTSHGHFMGSGFYQSLWEDTKERDVIRLTLIFNIDDASFVKSSKTTSTPISFIISELPENRRYCKENVFLSALWWGHNKAKYGDIWKIAVEEELNTLKDSGFNIELLETNSTCLVRSGVIVTDSVAKPKIMNIIQFNGAYGCPYCQHPGKSMRTLKGGSTMCYPSNGDDYQRKDHSFYTSAGIIAQTNQGTHMGIKGPCYLTSSMKFPDSFPIDYMHCVLEGVFKTLFSQKPFNSRSTTQKIDVIGRQVSLPHEFSRRFRKISEITYWKASECRTFLFYLTPLLRGCIDSDSFYLIISLTVALRSLVKMNIYGHDISIAESLLKIFISSYQEIYGEESMRFNIHLLSHLPAQVKKMGSLSNVSSFVFEDNIFKIKKTIHGNRGQNSQMTNRYLRSKYFLSHDVTMNLSSPYDKSLQLTQHIIGKRCKNIEIEVNVMRLLRPRFGNMDKNIIEIYTRCKKGHITYHSTKYSYKKSSTSYHFYHLDRNTQEKKYGRIEYFMLIPSRWINCGHDKIFAVYREFSSFSKQSLFTGIEKLKSPKLKDVPNIVKNSQIFHKIKLNQKTNIIELNEIQGKAIVTIDSIRSGSYYATALDTSFEHD